MNSQNEELALSWAHASLQAVSRMKLGAPEPASAAALASIALSLTNIVELLKEQRQN
jgi:hypothetical protein